MNHALLYHGIRAAYETELGTYEGPYRRGEIDQDTYSALVRQATSHLELRLRTHGFPIRDDAFSWLREN